MTSGTPGRALRAVARASANQKASDKAMFLTACNPAWFVPRLQYLRRVHRKAWVFGSRLIGSFPQKKERGAKEFVIGSVKETWIYRHGHRQVQLIELFIAPQDGV